MGQIEIMHLDGKKHHHFCDIVVWQISPESNHKETPDQARLKDVRQTQWPVIFKSIKVIKVEEILRNFSRLMETKSKKVKSLSRVQLCNPVDCSPPGSSVHGILQARVLEWVAISFSRASSQPRDRTRVSHLTGRLYRLSHKGLCIHSFKFTELKKNKWEKAKDI